MDRFAVPDAIEQLPALADVERAIPFAAGPKKSLGITLRTLYNKLNSYGLDGAGQPLRRLTVNRHSG